AYDWIPGQPRPQVIPTLHPRGPPPRALDAPYHVSAPLANVGGAPYHAPGPPSHPPMSNGVPPAPGPYYAPPSHYKPPFVAPSPHVSHGPVATMEQSLPSSHAFAPTGPHSVAPYHGPPPPMGYNARSFIGPLQSQLAYDHAERDYAYAPARL
ncbi:hypothetical protein HK101_004875, partial [Irineochytrium annulatum]